MNKRLPAEWEAQQAVVLSFPRRAGDYGDFIFAAADQHLDLCKTICRFVPVVLLVDDTELFDEVWAKREEQVTEGSGNARFDRVIHLTSHPLYLVHLPTNDVWARDFGPITLIENGKPLICDFQFNGWGQKYPADADNAVTAALVRRNIMPESSYLPLQFVLEGGSIESDGAGTVMSTSKCLLHPKRNTGLSRTAIIKQLKQILGAQQILLLDHGHLTNDDTDAHIDTIARFAPDNTIVYQGCDDSEDSHFQDFQKMAAQLATFKNAVGEPYELMALPWPPAVFSREDGRRLPASYANFLITNDAVVVPAIHEKSDLEAVAVLQRAFPDRLIVLQPADYLLEQHGSIHCLSMQLPLIPDCPAVPSI